MAEERRLVTVLFADVVGSTALGESLDPEDLRRLLSHFYEIAKRVVETHAGTLEKFIGDAAMAIFGLPMAHDDDARRALAAAIELRDGVRSDALLGDRLPIRVGINTGEVVASRDLGRGDFIVTGDAVNIAARLQQTAEPWEILASARTASAAGGAYEFGPARELELRGRSGELAARPLVGLSQARRPRTPLVGREADLAQLDLVARRAFAERRPYLVSLIAPAGTGKSRLVEEFLTSLESVAPDARLAVAQCLPYGQRLTYWPMRGLLLSLLDLSDEVVAPDAIRHRIREWLERVGAESAAETADLLAATIGASEADVVDRSALFAAWRTALEHAAADRPLVLLIEDLHWSSDSLLDLIEFILQPRGDAPMLMLALTRPELLERRPLWGGGRRNHVSLALEPLDERSIAQLVQNILDGPAPELVPIVVQRAEGNPFYAGEIVRSLVEHGVELGNQAALAAAMASLPDTIQATVLARLDLLDPPARRVIQLGSVFGRAFTPGAVAALEPGLADELSVAIDRLVDRDLLRPTHRGEVTFRHILIREVAYGTLPRAERSLHHEAAGRWLEANATGRGDALAELIAYHYREAATLAAASGEVDADLRRRAVSWLRRAAEFASATRGVAEAAGHLRAAIDLASPELQPELYQRLGDVWGGGDQSVQAYEDAMRIGAAQGRSADFLLANLARRMMVICRWFASVARQPSHEEILALIAQGRTWLPEAGPEGRARFLIAIGFMPFWLRNAGVRLPTVADIDQAKASVTEGLAIAEQLDDPALISAALDAMTSHDQVMNPEQARELSMRRIEMGRRLPLEERLDALNMVAWTSALLGDLNRAVESGQEAMALLQPGQNPGFGLAGAHWVAYGSALTGDWEALVDALGNLRQLWIEADRPAASFALQGLLSGIDWARNRGAEDHLARWLELADEIIGRFTAGHPVAVLRAITHVEMDGLAAIVVALDRYPDRAHYVEHALALCADRTYPVATSAVASVVGRASASGMRILEAQARRLYGLVDHDASELAGALRLFTETDAARYAARVRRELGLLTGDEAAARAGTAELERVGELDRLAAMAVRA